MEQVVRRTESRDDGDVAVWPNPHERTVKNSRFRDFSSVGQYGI